MFYNVTLKMMVYNIYNIDVLNFFNKKYSIWYRCDFCINEILLG